MKILFIHLAILMLTPCNLLPQSIGSEDSYMNNEIWLWSENGKQEVTPMGYSEKFFFCSNGRFYQVNAYSTGIYCLEWATGNYIFDAENNLILCSEIKNEQMSPMREKWNERIVERNQLLDTMRIETVSDAIVTLVQPEVDKSEGLFTTIRSRMLPIQGRYHRTVNVNALFPQNWNNAPYFVTGIWVGNYDKRRYVGKADMAAILQFANSAVYHDEFNDGRMMKMVTPDYQISICTGSDRKSSAIHIDVWSHGLLRIGEHWYKPAPGQDFEDFLSMISLKQKKKQQR